MKQAGITALQPMLLKSRTNAKKDAKSTHFFNIITKITPNNTKSVSTIQSAKKKTTGPTDQGKGTAVTLPNRHEAAKKQPPNDRYDILSIMEEFGTGLNPKSKRQYREATTESAYVLNPADILSRQTNSGVKIVKSSSEESVSSSHSDKHVTVFPGKQNDAPKNAGTVKSSTQIDKPEGKQPTVETQRPKTVPELFTLSKVAPEKSEQAERYAGMNRNPRSHDRSDVPAREEDPVENGSPRTEQPTEKQQTIVRRPVITNSETIEPKVATEQPNEKQQTIVRRPVTTNSETIEPKIATEQPNEKQQTFVRRPVNTNSETIEPKIATEQPTEKQQTIVRRPVITNSETIEPKVATEQPVEKPGDNRNIPEKGFKPDLEAKAPVQAEKIVGNIETKAPTTGSSRSDQPVSAATTKTTPSDTQRAENPLEEPVTSEKNPRNDSQQPDTNDQNARSETPRQENRTTTKQPNEPGLQTIEQVAQQPSASRIATPQQTPVPQSFNSEFLQKAMQELKEFETGTTAAKNWVKFEMTHEETGRVQTVLESENGKLQILLVAEDSEKMKYLQDAMKGLQEHFSRLGYEDVQVSYDYDRQHRRRNEQQPRNFARQRATTAPIEKLQAKPGRISKQTGYNTIDYVA